MSQPERILLDARLAIRGLGIATFIDRLMAGFRAAAGPVPELWKASGEWTTSGITATLRRSGLFDISPALDPRSRGYDVVHFACNMGSVLPGPRSVLTVHDLMHRRSNRRRTQLFGALLERSLVRAGRVVAVSARTQKEVELAFPQLAGQVQVIPHGLRRMPAPSGAAQHVLAFGGAADPRKRTDLMVAVYRSYQQSTPQALPLVVLARAGLTLDQRAQLIGLGARIRDQASPWEVDQLMGQAGALLYTTREEGFGLPILEAAEFGTPVVMDATAAVATEVIGSHCVLVGGTTLEAWADGLRQAIARGRVAGALDLPDWAGVASAYHRIYRELGEH